MAKRLLLNMEKIAESLGGEKEKLIRISAKSLALVSSCLKVAKVDLKELKMNRGTIANWCHPRQEGESVKARTFLTALFAIGLPPINLLKFETTPEYCDELSNMWQKVIDEYGNLDGFAPEGDLPLVIGDEKNKRWRQIEHEMEIYLAAGKERHGPNHFLEDPFKLHDPSPIDGVLDLITEGKFASNRLFNPDEIREKLQKRLSHPVRLEDVTRALDALEKRKFLEKANNGFFQVKDLTISDWKQVMEFRQFFEPMNIHYLFQEDRNYCLAMISHFRSWVREMEQALAAMDVATFFNADIRCHCVLTGSNEFRKALMRSSLPFIRMAGPRLSKPDYMRIILEDHKAIYDILKPYENEQFEMISLPDLEKNAGEALRMHLQNAMNLFQRV